MRSRELFQFLRGLRGLTVIGGEVGSACLPPCTVVQVCELTPEYDQSGVSAKVAAQAGYEIMCLALDSVKPPTAAQK